MGTIKEIEEAVERLSPSELDAFREWFSEFDRAAWDLRMEDDIAADHRPAMILSHY